MFLIKETAKENNTVEIRVDGILDSEALPTFKKVCEFHWQQEKMIILDLKGILQISEECRFYLEKASKRIMHIEYPKLMKLNDLQD